MTTNMTQSRDEERARKRAMTRSITTMIEASEECVTGSGSIEIISERLPRGGWGTMMDRNPKTGQVDYSHQDDEAERVMARLLYRKLSQAVADPGDVANVLLVTTISEASPEYMVPKMVTEVRAWSLYPADEGGFSAKRYSPAEVQELSSRDRYIREDLDEELGRLTGEQEEEPRQTFEEFMAQPLCDSFDENEARLLTYEEKLQEWEAEQRRLRELDAGEGQYMPEDEVRYL
ncbi:hypothetical protein BH20ACT11_BH20ACT11_15630 [soil metagenome]